MPSVAPAAVATVTNGDVTARMSADPPVIFGAIPADAPKMPRPSLIPNAPTPPPRAAAVTPPPSAAVASPVAAAAVAAVARAAEPRVLEALGGASARGPEYDALVKISREVIEQIAWEVVPELAETIIRAELDRLVKERTRA